ncbi:hypothetical protein CI109_103949 [Kwoniella shandongensis]|uniref:Uncharacterized protein n=1 Tax=Kwoniella shandongensis TaxID=1734106 RepID=A0A5M6BVK7_9TREE|nr:uncharacterized protein CI109_005597 [Kwoniella shandongensis]KAA5526002.1 hypothetical protein CI109_005597 [Kwoniella shandongensis]
MRGIPRSALAGPGPQTWLYRSTLFTSGTIPPPTWVTLSRPLATSTRTNGPKSRPLKSRNTADQRRDHAKSVKNSTHHSKVSQLVPQDTYVIRLRPPPNYPIDDHLHLFRQALENHNLDAVITTWSSLIDLGATSRLPTTDYAHISIFLVDVLSQRGSSSNLSKMATRDHERFGILRDIVIESAARNHWQGLHAFMLQLIEIGRPADVVSMFAKCKERMREIQGKDAKDLISWNREARLAARLEGEGMKPLIMINLAALTLLDAVDEHSLFGMLDSQADLRPTARFDFTPIQRVFRRIKGGEAMYVKYRQNVDKLILALQCFHPNALIGRISMLGHSREADGLVKLYKSILDASVGPGAFIRSRDLTEIDVQGDAYRNIPLPPIIWWNFIKAFEWRNDVNRIATMIGRDMPERGLQPTAHFLAIAMFHMGIIATRRTASSESRTRARAWADEYWRRLSAADWHITDEAFSRRIRVLGMLAWDEPRLKGEIERLYTAGKDGHLGEIGPRTRAAFVEFFMIQKKINDAFKVIKDLPKANQSDLEMSIATMIRRLALGHWGPQEKLKACGRALRLVAENNLRLGSHILGPLLAIQLEGGLPVGRTVDTILEHTLSVQHLEHGIQPWTSVLTGLLTKWTHNHSPNFVELQAGLYILRRASTKKLYGETRTRTVAMWTTFLRVAARSESTSVEQRQEFIDTALDLFPGGRIMISNAMYFEIIHLLLTRSDGSGLAEGWSHWEHFISEREVGAILWSKMLKLLLDKKREDFALDLVKMAWERKTVGSEEGFWLRAEDAGLTTKLGIQGMIDNERTSGRGKGKRSLERVTQSKDMVDDEGMEVSGDDDPAEMDDNEMMDPDYEGNTL